MMPPSNRTPAWSRGTRNISRRSALLAGLMLISVLGGGSAHGQPAAADVSAGSFHTCGLRQDGSASCWGEFLDEARDPAGAYIALSSGFGFSCGLRSDHSLGCWGEDRYGLGTLTPPSGTFDAVAAGSGHACGLTVGGTVTCWGYLSSAPAGTFTAVTSGSLFSCGIRASNIECWGNNDYGKASPPGGTFSSVAAGQYHACGVRTDSSVACWGHDDGGRASPPSGSFTAVTAGGSLTCGIRTDESVACWGRSPFPTPAGTFSKVSAGSSHACGIRTDSTVVCWGSNTSGATGGDAVITSEPPGHATVGDSFEHRFMSSGSPLPTYTVTSGTLPDGLTLSAEGVLSGVPTAQGTHPLTVSASNGLFADGAQTFTLQVSTCASGSSETGPVSALLHEVVEPSAGPAGETIHDANCEVLAGSGL